MAVEEQDGARVIAGRYRLRRELGRGGMGVVWHAWDTDLERDVAVKEVRLEADFSDHERENAYARVRREARSAARLSHPAIISVHDVLEYQGHPWIVMQLVQGRSLEQILGEDGALDAHTVAGIAAALLDALHTAHQAGIIHRDVKPANILYNGNPFLTDFGIANIEGETSITRTGAMVGSPAYMPPEAIHGHSTGAPADLWSLGVTLYALLDGQSLFHRPTMPATLAAIVNGEISPPRTAGPLGPVLLGLLTRDPQHRLDIPTAQTRLNHARAQLPAHPPATPLQPAGTWPAPQGVPSHAYSTLSPRATPPPHAAPPHHSPGTPNPAATPRPRPVPAGQHRAPRVEVNSKQLALWAGGGVVILVMLGLVVATVWTVLAPDTENYEMYAHERFTVEHPAGWETEDFDERASQGTEITHPDSSLELDMFVEYWDVTRDDSVQAELELLQNELGETAQSYEVLDEGTQERDDLPEGWEAAFMVAEVTIDPEESDYNELDRYVAVHLVRVEDSDYVVMWSVPQEQYESHAEVIDHTGQSLEPQT